MVTIKSYGSGACIWCGREKEGVEVTTDDRSFVGFLCFGDLRRMLKLKTSSGNGPATKPPAAVPSE